MHCLILVLDIIGVSQGVWIYAINNYLSRSLQSFYSTQESAIEEIVMSIKSNVDIMLSERSQWHAFEKRMINIDKRYGKIAEALTSGSEPTFVMEPPTAGRASVFETSIQMEESQAVNEGETRVRAQQGKVHGIMDSMGSTIECSLRAEEEFDVKYNTNDYLGRCWRACVSRT